MVASNLDLELRAVARAERKKLLVELPAYLGPIIIIIAVLFSVLSSLGVNTAPLLAGAGVMGLAIGFGAQTLVKDVVSGVFFLLDDAFRMGEYVDVGGMPGTVQKISIRSMHLRDAKGPIHIVPYGSISKLTNISFLPSVFTTVNLFMGYLAVVQIFKTNYITASYLVIFGVVMDGFDGTIARLTKTESSFGMQFDSLVDAVTFGLVSGIMIYQWGFQTLNFQFGQIIGFIFD